MRRRRVKGRHPGLGRRQLLGVGRHEYAPPVHSICPTVIRTLEPHPVDDATERQPGASMHAQVAPGEELLAGTPHNEVLAEHPGRNRSSPCHIPTNPYTVPTVYTSRAIHPPFP